MSDRAFPKRFDYKEAEDRLYQRWREAHAFQPAYGADGALLHPERKDAQPYVIVIPPPNVTGRLHMGHALNNTIQDVLIRYKRMDGFDALWVPGTDHAGIATQTVVKKQLDAQGIDYRELGREETVKRIWEWKHEYGDEILKQLQRIGCSCDWTRTRFTMDEGLNLAVRHAFVSLYEQGLIYRGKRIVNWCPVDRTALSDDEVEKEDAPGKMYDIRYPLEEDPSKFVTVSTTRPETLFGDVAVAVHPDDERYKDFVGKTLILPLQERRIPVITDEHADPELGTGCVKITPAHDPNDFEVGQRAGLEGINVMHEDATMNDVVPERYRGLERYAARKKALEELEEKGLLAEVRDHRMAVGKSYRSKVPIEFRLSDQWFVKMEPLAKKALEASGYELRDGEWVRGAGASGIGFHPQHHEKVYVHWLSNIRDWCISRQIWWGHRIPAWYHNETGETLVAMETPERVAAEPEAWHQESDVLDTWFSSWLWPLSTLGWPERTDDFKRYYPTSVLSTAKDILFFWVARMNFAGLLFEDRLPYHDVYLHSTVTDDRGITMSKSKGNGIDPLTVIDGASVEDLKRPVMEARPTNMKELLKRIEKNFPDGFPGVGADAMRWTLVYSITEGERVRLSFARFTEGRNFITKLWNGAGRVITALEEELGRGEQAAPAEPTDRDRWLMARRDHALVETRKGLDRYDFGHMASELYHFVWDDFCSWALELSKPRLASEDAAERRGTLQVLGRVLADTLRMLHPVVPFVTEELWLRLRPAMSGLGLWDAEEPREMLALDRFPATDSAPDTAIQERFAILQRLVVAVRQLRASSNVKDNLSITVQVKPLAAEARQIIEQSQEPLCFLARLEAIEFVDERSPGMISHFDKAFELYIDLAKYVDLDEELERLGKAADKSRKLLDAMEKKLGNANFIERAPAEKVAEARAAAESEREKIAKLESTIEDLKAARG